MEFALTTLLLLPGVVSLAIATGPRHRASAPRDIPAALIAILGFALVNFVAAAIACKLTPRWGAPKLGASVSVMLTGNPCEGLTREGVLGSLFNGHWQHWLALVYLALATLASGALGATLHTRLLQIIARRESGHSIEDNRSLPGKCFDWVLQGLEIHNLAMARGASYWLIVEQTAKLLAHKQPEIYADIVQGEGAESKLFAGQVKQVISSRSGETLSIVLNKAQRYRGRKRDDSKKDEAEEPDKAALWNRIGDSEAFYMRGETVQNISYRIYGDPAKGGYIKKSREGKVWMFPEGLIEALSRQSEPDAPEEADGD